MEQLEDTKQELAAMIGKMDCLHTELMGTRKELNDAKEEIAVKVAQVKQYQKQVEAYKQQLEQVLCRHFENRYICIHMHVLLFGRGWGSSKAFCLMLSTHVHAWTCK